MQSAAETSLAGVRPGGLAAMFAPICASLSRSVPPAVLRSICARGLSLTTATRSGDRPRIPCMGSGVDDAFVSITDEGALPFVIAARIETAVRRAGLITGKAALPDALPLLRRLSRPIAAFSPLPAGQRAEVLHQCRIARSRRGHSRPRRFRSPRRQGCCTAPGPQRTTRRRFRFRGAHGAYQSAPTRHRGSGRDRPAVPDLILIPKVESAAQVSEIDAVIKSIAKQNGLTRSRTIWLMPILESALGIENAFAIATASANIAA